ncbi:MAG: hypothetical protein JXB15_11730 [Anaerolineales bacterium]|nr:hypothetical protein [Anaerolineales bacterium]
MAALVQSYPLCVMRIGFVCKRDQVIERLLPRKCILIPAGLSLVGMVIPLLMWIGLLPLTLGLCFLGFALTASGCTSALILCGEL